MVNALPERLCQVKFFDLRPARGCTQVDVVRILDIGPGVEQGAKDGESSGCSALIITASILRSRSSAVSLEATSVFSFWSRSLLSKNVRRG